MSFVSEKSGKRRVRPFVLAVGIVFLMGAIYFLLGGVRDCIKQLDEESWTVTAATVISVEESRSNTKSYNIIYSYETGYDIYTGKIYESNEPKKIGDCFEVKYDPNEPNESTTRLKPTLGTVISGISAFLIFGVVGCGLIKSAFGESLWVGCWYRLIKKYTERQQNK